MKVLQTLLMAATAAVIAASADAATTLIPGVYKREQFNGATRAQVTAGTGLPTPIVTTESQWDLPDRGENYTARHSGVIIPATSGNYDFYLAADDDTDLYISTNSSPTGKYLIAHEPSWNGVRAWRGGQQSSPTFTNSLGTPFAAGIPLVAGQRYYLEAIQREGGGGDNFAVTMVPAGEVPTSGDATTLTGNLIGLEIQTPTQLSFTVNPSNTTAYVGMAAHFNVAVSTDSELPAGYQWRRNGTAIEGATSANYTLMASSTDTGATFDCVVRVPAIGTAILTRTSTVATVTVPATGGVVVNGFLKRQVMAGYTTANVRTNVNNGNGGKGVASAVNVFDVPSAGANYAERVSGFFTPATSGAYVFFLAADDDTDLYLSTDDQPRNKRRIAQELIWSNNRSWNTLGDANGSLAQKRSDQFVPNADTGETPFANGINLVAGTRYYIEAIHRAGGGGNGVSVTAVLKSDADLGIPADNDPSTLTNAVISYVTSPVTSFNVAGPANVTVFEGLNYKFEAIVTTDSEISPRYQWKKGGVAIQGATGSSLSGVAALSDSGSTYSVDISIPGVTNYSSGTATLTVQQSVFAEGTLKLERWNGTDMTRAIIGANAIGTVREADSVRYVTSGFDITDSGSDYVLRVSGFFVPATSGNYVFYLAADDDTDVYLGTNDKAETKRLIAHESGWSGNKNWNTVGGGSTLSQRRSDQFVPDPNTGETPFANGIALTAGTRYYIEAVNHQGGGGQNLAVTFTRLGDPDPANGSATALIGPRVGVLVPAATSLGITQDVSSASALVTQPVTFLVGATNNGLLPTAYQWRRNGTAINGATSRGYNFIVSSADNGAQFSCVMSVPGTTLAVTSSVATLTVGTGGSVVSGQLGFERWFGNVNRPAVLAGNGGVPTAEGTITALDLDTFGDNYAQRVRGYFIPPTTGKYTFFICSDDDSDLFLGTNDDPSTKRLIAQQNVWANPRNWVSTGNGDPVVISQKRSDTWVPDPANPPVNGAPYTGGIQLTAGQRYYIEAVHAEGGGGDNLGVTYKFDPTDTGNAADPTDGDPSLLTGNVIGYLAAPASKTVAITRNGNSVNVSWSPAGGRLISAPALPTAPAAWTDLGAANPQTITIQSGNQFFQVVNP